jgi:hypothetical protein
MNGYQQGYNSSGSPATDPPPFTTDPRYTQHRVPSLLRPSTASSMAANAPISPVETNDSDLGWRDPAHPARHPYSRPPDTPPPRRPGQVDMPTPQLFNDDSYFNTHTTSSPKVNGTNLRTDVNSSSVLPRPSLPPKDIGPQVHVTYEKVSGSSSCKSVKPGMIPQSR